MEEFSDSTLDYIVRHTYDYKLSTVNEAKTILKEREYKDEYIFNDATRSTLGRT